MPCQGVVHVFGYARFPASILEAVAEGVELDPCAVDAVFLAVTCEPRGELADPLGAEELPKA